jgi:hypothetical protein
MCCIFQKQCYLCTVAMKQPLKTHKMDLYPKTIETTFERTFELLSEAKNFAKTNNSFVQRKGVKNYLVEYNGFSNNFLTTGRKFFIIDKDFNVTHNVVTLIRNIHNNSLIKLENYEGVYTSKAGLEADIYVNIEIEHNRITNNIVTEIINREKQRYFNIREAEKLSTRMEFFKR